MAERDDEGIVPYESAARGAAVWAVGDAGPYECVAGGAAEQDAKGIRIATPVTSVTGSQ